MSVQVKRGTTESWNLGPELVNFGSLSVNGADSTIHCEGKTMSMYIGTSSASDFDNDGEKTTGLWLIKSGELPLDAGSYKISLKVEMISYSGGGTSWGTLITVGEAPGNRISHPTATGSTPIEKTITISSSEDVLCYVSWGEEVSVDPIEITLSIKKVGEYESLLPGQIGCEYLDENGSAAIKVGPKNASDAETKWNNIPYVGQVLPTEMYGPTFPENPVKGQLFFLEVI